MFDVLLYDRPIGTVARRGRGIRFQYLPEALDDDSVPALSLALPKVAAPYPDSKAGPYFRNLLPEQAYRRLVATAAGPALEDLALLGAIGGECPGAVSIWPAETRPDSIPEYTGISSEALGTLFRRGHEQDLAAAVARGRLSLPGVQEKIALLRQDDGSWHLPLHGAVTSHILKQATLGFPGLLENELLCMALAKAAGLQVASADLAAPDVRIFCTERFDRTPRRQKLHQEDFCQILKVEPDSKYENDGGPGLKACSEVLRRYSALPADDLKRLTQWTGFNYLIGNEDAHAKNLALLYRADGLHLTPFYDLVSTAVYPLERRLAMNIGRATDIRNLQRSDWERFAAVIGLPWPQVRAWLLEVGDNLISALDETVDRCRQNFGDAEVYAAIETIVGRHGNTFQREIARGSY